MDRVIIEGQLTQFANAVGPCKKYWREGKIAVQKIVDCLKQDPGNGGYDIGWMLYGGSVGKGTALRESDFDVILFINHHRPPLEDCIIHFEDVLRRNQHRLQIEGLTAIPMSLQLKITSCDMNLDLVPAANFLERTPFGWRQRDRILEQHRRALQALRNERNPEKVHPKYSTSLSGYQRQFMRDLGEFAKQAVRLAKFWFKSLYIGKPCYGAKTMLDLIMAASVLQERNDSLLSAFNRFLSKVSVLGTTTASVRIEFTERNGRWDLAPSKPGSQGGYIMDPSNPYNDFLKLAASSPIFLANLVKAAKATQDRLTGAVVFNLVENMFLPQFFPFGEGQLQLKRIGNVLFDQELVYSSRNPDMKIHKNGNKLRQPDYHVTLEAVKKFLIATVNSSAFSPDNNQANPSDVMMKAQGKCHEMITKQVLGREMNWTSTSTSFDTCDVVLTVPVPNAFPSSSSSTSNGYSGSGDNLGAIKFGFSWTN